MAHGAELSERERRVLEAVIQSYVASAEPAGSRTLSRQFGLGISPATIRNTMSDLEDKGFLFHPHTSAGRIPTDKAYRTYVDSLMRIDPLTAPEQRQLEAEISAGGSAIETILRRAAQSLGILTQELGVALGPRLERAALRQLELVRVSSDRLLMVLSLTGGAVRTIFVEVPGVIADEALIGVTIVLNERLAGLTLAQVRTSLASRLRDVQTTPETAELLNIFLQEGDQVFGRAAAPIEPVVLGQASLLADQPEFATGERMRQLIELTETRQRIATLLEERPGGQGLSITIGNEHGDPKLEPFTVVTAGYQAGSLSGVIGVIGPTRMPYEKVISLVEHTSRLVSDLLC
ncbi:MAG TPA: heat-inducible transcription repressor HrcA [Gemmatimonas aurantiaca]|uniref:Heat-inducible transcription repressor HrcA n=2 Tax=Gemmatimonas aurantiaca TaxID=173480 RepID=C1A4B6_GEMAT|nr:heat-inducible transcriptional repressor HrcA [Gemmatimonas aurantiaca]BAH38941.1 heat-inducible transcription repressor HrcA [Gemmatimonas aurantiaca T-27]HCT57173.1 heat-inducible transcription repressor HrcA [Gemmatimonas aurantiaca]